MKNPALYVVATPIGNKSDITLRALEVLKKADVIACEDSRVSKKLLDSYGINTKLLSYHKFNEKARCAEIKKLIKEGKIVALISDAGTPCISDPGRILVEELIKEGIEVTSVPGASAVITFLSQIPRRSEEFAFAGFLPRVKSQQEKILQKYSSVDFVFYESANRLLETLENIKDFRGQQAKIAIGRELTKIYEETLVDSVENIIDYYQKNTLKGEIVVVVYADEKAESSDSELTEQIKRLKKLKKPELSDKDISAVLSELTGVNKNRIYKIILSLK